METNNRNGNTHHEGKTIFEGKNVDNLVKLMQDVRLQFKRAHKELNRRDKWKKVPHLDIF